MGSYAAPLYSIHRYTDEVYKVIAFKRSLSLWDSPLKLNKEAQQSNDAKLNNNFSRARSMVLQYARCNPWEYFFTGTLDQTKLDRYDLTSYASRLMQFIRDKRKKYGVKFQVLLVPEQHQDGARHIHGLVHGLPASVLSEFVSPAPQKLIDGHFLNWPDYMEKFGFCSLAPIRDPIATAFYISKYVSKELSQRAGELGKHLYFHSRPLKHAELASSVYLPNSGLDGCCTKEYEFCKTGMVEDKTWSFPYLWDGVEVQTDGVLKASWTPLAPPQAFHPFEIDPFYEQLRMEI